MPTFITSAQAGQPVCSVFSRRELLLSILALGGAGRLPGEEQPVTFSSDVKVVNVLATVRDGQGQIIRNLSKEDFILEEDGRPQTIRYFSQQAGLPLTLGLLVDTSLSQRRVLEEERRASYRFLEQVLRPEKDLAFVIHFDHEVELLQDLTSSRKDLERSLESLEVPQMRRRSGGRGGGYPGSRGGGGPGYPPPQGGGQRGAGTTLYDAVLLASDELMKKQTGRKAVILLTDGVDMGSKVSISAAIESAQRADTLAYSIRFYDTQGHGGGFGTMGPRGRGRGGMGGPRGRYPAQRPDGKKVLERISQETGGSYFEVSGKEPIDRIYRRIEEELRNQYSLGYTSDKQEGAGEFRRIRLAVRQKGLVVQARDGYWARR